MQELIAIVFQDQVHAGQLANKLVSLNPDQRIWLKDAALVARDETGAVATYALPDLVGSGELGGLFWGFLFTLIFFTKWWELSIPLTIQDEFVKEAGDAMGKGDSGLFMYTSDGDAALAAIDTLPEASRDGMIVVRNEVDPGEHALIQNTFRKM